jgi:hypothetical protein
MPEKIPGPTGRLIRWPLLAPWGPPRPHRDGERVAYLTFPSWERYLAGEGGAAAEGLPAPPLPPLPGAEPLLAPEPPNFLASLASLWRAISRGEPLGGALPSPAPADPADSQAAIRGSILGQGPPAPPSPAAPAGPSVPPELALALWALGAFSGWEAEGLLREAARRNAGLLDALKGPLSGVDLDELGYEAMGLSGLGPPVIPGEGGSGPGGGTQPGGGSPPGGGIPDAPVFSAPPPSARGAAALRDMWLGAARPLLRPGDRLAASGDGFEGLLEGLLPPDTLSPGDFVYVGS